MKRPVDQRRRFRRHELDAVQGSVLFRLEVKVLNLSLSGMAAETTEQLKLGKVYALKLGGEGELVVPSTVRWCRLVGTQRRRSDGELMNVYRAGLTFDESS
ncbi:MAG: PilZ domain-containing protein, partial [Thermoanaerobaculia bacterium]